MDRREVLEGQGRMNKDIELQHLLSLIHRSNMPKELHYLV